ncbi:hypothetical protein Goshw_000726 [Gossypium schwendimanii]|uniref:Uncharacterized protein n=1 Tax=Gossypium schwendimanii TaxID=34291 RepID=A0A7J9L017_GOSSC|nr:hypothetical protein [Gossypium schwendimanii]
MLRSCAGIVVRYDLGFVLGYASIINSYIPTAFVAEALAYYHAICLGIDLGLQEAKSLACYHAICLGIDLGLQEAIFEASHTNWFFALITSLIAGSLFLCYFFDPLLVLVLCSSAGAGSLFLCWCFVPLLHHR